jgi:hypothetical protein
MIYYEKQIKEITKDANGNYNLVYNHGENGYTLCEMSWTEVPTFHKDGRVKTSEEFKSEQVAKNGLIYFEQNYGNCVGYNTTIDIDGKLLKIGELYDSL